jgi:DNA-binding GntR family transcriptional regulator
LERVGLVSLEPARGAFVRQPDATEAGELFAVRAMLEGNLAEHLAARLSEAQIASLRRHLADEAAAVERGDTESRTRLLTDFHRLLVNMAGNQVLAEVLGDLLSRSALIALTAQTPDAAEHSHEEHVQIVNALAAGDGVLTSRLMSEHLAHVGAALRPLPELGAVASAAASPSPALAL